MNHPEKGYLSEFNGLHQKLPDIRSLGEIQRFELIESIRRSNGDALILIHPFVPLSYYPTATERVKGFNKKMTEAITQKNLPKFIFEEAPEIQQLRLRLAPRLFDIETTIPLVPTETDNPTPKLTSGTKKEQWWLITEELLWLGVTKVKIGGRYFYYLNEGGLANGCVTVAYRKLRPHFEASLEPQLCFPNQPL